MPVPRRGARLPPLVPAAALLAAGLGACATAVSAPPPAAAAPPPAAAPPASAPPAAPEPTSPPPPLPKEKPVESPALARYLEYLAETGAVGVTDAKEDPRWAFAGWHFFLRSTMPGDKRTPAAVAGTLIVHERPTATGWHRLLTDGKGLPPAELAERVNWVLGMSGVATAALVSDKKARKLVTPPALSEKGGAVVFTFWQISPPDMDTPYRVEITAPASGPAHIKHTLWSAVAGKK